MKNQIAMVFSLVSLERPLRGVITDSERRLIEVMTRYKRRQAIRWLGENYVCHPARHVKRVFGPQ